jgi:SAM-dependent methyltransferase
MSQVKYEQIGVAMTCRSYEEYIRMFALNPSAVSTGPILDVAAGASSFVAEAYANGTEAVAVDPQYGNGFEEIIDHASREIETSTAKLDRLKEHLDWTFYGDLTRHKAMREASLHRFAEDFRSGKEQGRYVAATLPQLPFASDTFALVVSSHFLFLYHEQFDYEFHISAIRELYRVCRPGGEIRLYPVMTLGFEPYPYMDRLLTDVRAFGGKPTIGATGLPFIPASVNYLRIDKAHE